MIDLVKVLPLVMALVSCTVSSAPPDDGEDQFSCMSTGHFFPFVALLMNLDAICTAAILSPSWMISSAYCCKKSGNRTFLAYAGCNDVSVAQKMQHRLAHTVMWTDPVSGAVAQDASKQLPLVLLITSAPWTTNEEVHPVTIDELQLSPSALRENGCMTVGFHFDKSLAVTSCVTDAYWDENDHLCFNSSTNDTVAMAPGSLLYCDEPDILIGVSPGHNDLLQHTSGGSLTTLHYVESCFAYLGRGALMDTLEQIVDNQSVVNDLRDHMPETTSILHSNLKEENHAVTFIPARRTASRVNTVSDSDYAPENENQEDVGRFLRRMKRVFAVDIDPNYKDEAKGYWQNLATTHQLPPPDVSWALVPALVAVCLLVYYCAAVQRPVHRLYTCLWRKNSSYQCVQ